MYGLAIHILNMHVAFAIISVCVRARINLQNISARSSEIYVYDRPNSPSYSIQIMEE